MGYAWFNAVWELSEAKGAPLCVLLSMAEPAEDDGITIQKTSALAAAARVTDRGVRAAIRQLIKDQRIEQIRASTAFQRGKFRIIEPAVVALVLEIQEKKVQRMNRLHQTSAPPERRSGSPERSSAPPERSSAPPEPASVSSLYSGSPLNSPGIRGDPRPARAAPIPDAAPPPDQLPEPRTAGEAWEQLLKWKNGELDFEVNEVVDVPGAAGRKVTRAAKYSPTLSARTISALDRSGGWARLDATKQRHVDIAFLFDRFCENWNSWRKGKTA